MTESKPHCLPSLARGNGTGHLMRCAWIVETVAGGSSASRKRGSPVFLPPTRWNPSWGPAGTGEDSIRLSRRAVSDNPSGPAGV